MSNQLAGAPDPQDVAAAGALLDLLRIHLPNRPWATADEINQARQEPPASD